MLELICGGDWNVSRMGIVSGKFFFKFGESDFPSVDWSDFPISILEAWYDELVIKFDDMNEFELCFFDGEYAIHITKQITDTHLFFHVDFVSEYASESAKVEHSCCKPAWMFFTELAQATNTCIRFCKQHHYPIKKLFRIHNSFQSMADEYHF